MGAEFDRDVQNWSKILGIWGKQGSRHGKNSRSWDFNSRAFYAHVRLVDLTDMQNMIFLISQNGSVPKQMKN